MNARGGFRGGFNSQAGYSKPPYDGRGYAQSPGHGTPASSFHGSPTMHSPHGGTGRGWTGQAQYPAQGGQFSPTYSHGYGPPTAPQAHYHANQAPSPTYPPTGPANQYPSPYRGGHRGGFRGSPSYTLRGGPRPGFKNAQWSPQAGNGRLEGQDSQQGASQPAADYRNDAAPEKPDVEMTDSDNLFRPSKELQVEDSSKEQRQKEERSKEERPKEEKAPPTSRPPPTGPQSSTPNKFSFSMKTATRLRQRGRGETEIGTGTGTENVNESANATATVIENENVNVNVNANANENNAPTEPASARPRPGVPTGPADRRPLEPPRLPDRTPKTRKVKKTVRRLKEKPVLPDELAASKSVFFRKPGNESVVGSGTYGKVFKGLNVYTKKLVALKKIRMEGEKDGFPVTAVREIKLLRSLRHKNIVQLQEVMVEANNCFMVFEYLSHDLTGLLNHPTYVLEPAHKKHLAQQLFEGLDYLHTRGVLHRDIKAANILVSSEGVLKLADFGLARFYAKHHKVDYTNRVITIWYRSPELLLGETQYGPAVDIWSAACVLVEIFTKKPIFPGDGTEINQMDKLYSVLGTPSRNDWPGIVEMPWFPLLRPTHRRPSVFEQKYKDQLTPAAFDLLAAMFRYDPDKRPTAAEVLQHDYFIAEEPEPRQAID
ncbi:hypothetical protein VTJ49DRAFT_6920 [Mycothermus thermophilus]|uniref:cyclin-dependent kinase n=1 Tax=Humicola insolens TaxID=85995 RepID=A0ABR3V0R9_HUMIN